MKNKIFLSISILILVAIILWVSFEDVRTGDKISLITHSEDYWPFNHSWSWKINSINVKKSVRIQIRSESSDLLNGVPSISISQKIPLSINGNEKHSSWKSVYNKTLSGKLQCQLIDLREVRLDENVQKPLRLIVNLKTDSGIICISGIDSVIEGDAFVGSVEMKINSNWENNSIHMLTIYTKSDKVLFEYHILLEQMDSET